MENRKLNEKIIENVRNRVVMSNLESEEIMKANIKKQILSVLIITLVVLTGGVATVNAATNGELVNKVVDTVRVIFIKDGQKQDVEGYIYTDPNNNTIEKYSLGKNGEDYEFTLEVNKNTLEDNDYIIENIIEDDEVKITIK